MAVNVLVCEAEHEELATAPSVKETEVVPQPSEAVALPRAASISEAVGLHPSVVVVPEAVIAGAPWSTVHVTVEEAVALLPQPSLAVNVLVWEAVQLLVEAGPSVNVTDGVPQAAVAVAEPRAALISEAEGLQPRVGVTPVIIIVGGFGAKIQVTVLELVALLPQSSMAVNVLVCDAEHEVVATTPSVNDTEEVPQPSEAVALPRAASISEAVGLHPSEVVVPVAVITGGVRSAVHVTVLDVVAVLPQSSMAVNVLVCEAEHEELATAPSVNETEVVPQPSEAVAVPRAALISEAVGLHPRLLVVPVGVITGGI
jgi:hypothetical protein